MGVLAIDNREDDILDHATARSNTEVLLQKVLSAFAFALENAATENYYSNQTEIPPDSCRLLYCLNNCQYTVKVVLPAILASLSDLEQLSLEKAESEARSMYSVLDAKLFDAYMELKCEPIIAIIEPNMYQGKFDWAKCVRPTAARNYVKEILHSAGCVHAWVDIRCIEACLKPFLVESSTALLGEAQKPLLVLEKPGDIELVDSCLTNFQRDMRRHIQCFETKAA